MADVGWYRGNAKLQMPSQLKHLGPRDNRIAVGLGRVTAIPPTKKGWWASQPPAARLTAWTERERGYQPPRRVGRTAFSTPPTLCLIGVTERPMEPARLFTWVVMSPGYGASHRTRPTPTFTLRVPSCSPQSLRGAARQYPRTQSLCS
jgi:hypothetical protein